MTRWGVWIIALQRWLSRPHKGGIMTIVWWSSEAEAQAVADTLNAGHDTPQVLVGQLLDF